jgi:hypothetical protein
MADAKHYKRDVRLPFQEIQGQAIVVVPARRELHEFDEVATFLWAQLAKERSVGDLVSALCGEFEVEAGAAEADVREFLAGLEAKGLVLRA